jgi:hypothetical protein
MEHIEQAEFGDLFIHLPIVFLEHRFDGIVKPSVTFSDDGIVAIIEWHYDSSIAPSPHGTLQISLQAIWPTQFKVSCPLVAFGTAGAGCQIACIRYDAVGFQFRGEIDPFEVYFQIGLDAPNEDLYFESRLGNVNTQNFSFDSFPRPYFPIDQILNLILTAVETAAVRNQSGSILNVTRFSVANFGLLKGFGSMIPNLAAASDNPISATTFGVTFTKQ